MLLTPFFDPLALARALRGEQPAAGKKVNGTHRPAAPPRGSVFPQALARWQADAPKRELIERRRQEHLARQPQSQPPERPRIDDHPAADVPTPAAAANDPAPEQPDDATDPCNPWG